MSPALQLELSHKQTADFELLANGGFAPLDGFQGHAAWETVTESMRLPDGHPWPIPVTLASEVGDVGDTLTLIGHEGTKLGTITVEEVYERDLRREAQQVFRTTDEAHPGVAMTYREGARTIAGPIAAEALPGHIDAVKPYVLSPAETKRTFAERGWKTVVAFQTRNPIHRAHEYLTKAALEICDGLYIHPLIGETKKGDIPADVRMRCYEVLMENYYHPDHVMLGVNPGKMHYAGPREAILHAIIRRNYGCTHFIVGRDHAGVGNYYGTYDAHYIFDEFDPAKIGITPLFYEHTFWCEKCEGMASTKTCPHGKENHIALSGTKVREMLRKKLAQAGISKIQIERPAKTARVTINTARPGVVIGKRGEDIEKLRKQVTDMMGVPVHINVAGRLNGAEIARSEWYREGRVPLHTLRADIDYGFAEAKTTYGVIGVKVWVFKGEVLEKAGAVQHRVGVEGADLIVAINTDPNAPIFDFANVGVVADAVSFLPALTDVFVRRLAPGNHVRLVN